VDGNFNEEVLAPWATRERVLELGRRLPTRLVRARRSLPGQPWSACWNTYSGIHHPARALPESLERLRLQVEERVGRRFNSALCNLYRDGSDSVSWHSDNDYGCGDQPWVASVSFGGTRRFKIRRNSDRKVINFEMESGSLLLMKDLAQVEWEHCVPKTSRPVSPRINITFRHIG